MATRTFHNSTRGGDDTPSITSASFTPTANSLLIICTNFTIKNGDDNTASIEITNTGGLEFEKLIAHTWAPIAYSGNANVWYCEIGSSPSSLTVTITENVTGDAAYGSSMDIFDYTDYNTGNLFGLVNTFTRGDGFPDATSGDGAWNVTLSASPASDSEVVAMLVIDGVASSNTASPGSGWTEIADPGSNQAQQIQVRTGSTSTALGWADTCDHAFGAYVNLAIAFEVKAAAGGGGATRGTPFGHRGTAFNGGRTFYGIIQ